MMISFVCDKRQRERKSSRAVRVYYVIRIPRVTTLNDATAKQLNALTPLSPLSLL
jgi:hypothetical protein